MQKKIDKSENTTWTETTEIQWGPIDYVVIYVVAQTLTLWLEKTSKNFRVWTTKSGRLKTFLGIYQKQIIKKRFLSQEINDSKIAVRRKTCARSQLAGQLWRHFWQIPQLLKRWYFVFKNIFWQFVFDKSLEKSSIYQI